MKKIWFKRKLYGWGWTPATWQGWLVIAIYFLIVVSISGNVGVFSHSAGDTLIGIVAPVLALTVVLVVVAWFAGEKPRWQWGERVLDVSDVLFDGGIAVLATDTTYGILGSALNEKVVNEIYRLRKRDLDKPFIVLISDKKDLKKFGVKLTIEQEKILEKVWSAYAKPSADRSGPTSVILPVSSEKFAYLHRGRNTLAFRLPEKESLRRLIREVGPLVAPSANPQGHPVARTISEARAYFGHHVDPVVNFGDAQRRGTKSVAKIYYGVNFYEDSGVVIASPSRLIDITDGTEKVLR